MGRHLHDGCIFIFLRFEFFKMKSLLCGSYGRENDIDVISRFREYRGRRRFSVNGRDHGRRLITSTR